MSDALEHQTRQLMRRLNIQAQPVREDQYVQVSMTAFDAGCVVGFRRQEEDGPFTGWEIVATTDEPESAKYGYYSVQELAALRPSWIVGLQLPTGWAFRFDGDTLVDCVSDKKLTSLVNLRVKTIRK